jgi:hypothetical protein
LESIAIFNPDQSATHLGDFDQYMALVEQRLCGGTNAGQNCTEKTFVQTNNNDAIDPEVSKFAIAQQALLGLPRAPLVANVHFPRQAAAYETLRLAYRDWLATHDSLAQQVTGKQLEAASETSAGESTQKFAQVVSSANAAGQVARDEYNKIWQGVYRTTGINQALAIAFLIMGLVAAWGVWQRRSQLFA